MDNIQDTLLINHSKIKEYSSIPGWHHSSIRGSIYSAAYLNNDTQLMNYICFLRDKIIRPYLQSILNNNSRNCSNNVINNNDLCTNLLIKDVNIFGFGLLKYFHPNFNIYLQSKSNSSEKSNSSNETSRTNSRQTSITSSISSFDSPSDLFYSFSNPTVQSSSSISNNNSSAVSSTVTSVSSSLTSTSPYQFAIPHTNSSTSLLDLYNNHHFLNNSHSFDLYTSSSLNLQSSNLNTPVSFNNISNTNFNIKNHTNEFNMFCNYYSSLSTPINSTSVSIPSPPASPSRSSPSLSISSSICSSTSTFINEKFTLNQMNSVVDILLQNYLNIPDITGMTPLHWACLKGNMKCVRILLKYGANSNTLACYCHSNINRDKDKDNQSSFYSNSTPTNKYATGLKSSCSGNSFSSFNLLNLNSNNSNNNSTNNCTSHCNNHNHRAYHYYHPYYYINYEEKDENQVSSLNNNSHIINNNFSNLASIIHSTAYNIHNKNLNAPSFNKLSTSINILTNKKIILKKILHNKCYNNSLQLSILSHHNNLAYNLILTKQCDLLITNYLGYTTSNLFIIYNNNNFNNSFFNNLLKIFFHIPSSSNNNSTTTSTLAAAVSNNNNGNNGLISNTSNPYFNIYSYDNNFCNLLHNCLELNCNNILSLIFTNSFSSNLNTVTNSRNNSRNISTQSSPPGLQFNFCSSLNLVTKINYKEVHLSNKKTLLHYACLTSNPDIEIIRYLINQGILINWKDSNGLTVIDYLLLIFHYYKLYFINNSYINSNSLFNINFQELLKYFDNEDLQNDPNLFINSNQSIEENLLTTINSCDSTKSYNNILSFSIILDDNENYGEEYMHGNDENFILNSLIQANNKETNKFTPYTNLNSINSTLPLTSSPPKITPIKPVENLYFNQFLMSEWSPKYFPIILEILKHGGKYNPKYLKDLRLSFKNAIEDTFIWKKYNKINFNNKIITQIHVSNNFYESVLNNFINKKNFCLDDFCDDEFTDFCNLCGIAPQSCPNFLCTSSCFNSIQENLICCTVCKNYICEDCCCNEVLPSPQKENNNESVVAKEDRSEDDCEDFIQKKKKLLICDKCFVKNSLIYN